MSKYEEIKFENCPICDGEVYVNQEDCYGNVYNDWLIHCDNCGLQFGFTSQFKSKEEAAHYWNKRIPLEKIVKRLEEENNRLKKLKNSFIALSDHEVCDIENAAYNYSINLVKKMGGLE